MVYEHLRQIPNTPFYITPDEPADPRDCARYPDSLYCGGNPFSRRPVALKPQIVNNKCAKGVKVTPVLGFVKLPPVEVIYIEPSCRPPAPPPGAGEPKIPSGDGLCPGGEFVGFNGYLLPTCAGDGNLIGYRARIVVSRQFPYGSGQTQDYYQVSRWVNWDPDPLTRNVYQCKFQVGNEIIVIANIGGIVRYVQEDVDNGLSLSWEIQGICDPAFIPGPPPPPDVPPPPPPPPKKCDCMGCCPPSPTQDKNDRDLEEIKRLLRLLVKRVGEPEKVTLFDEDPNKPGRQKKTKTEETLFKAVRLATQRAEVVSQIVGIEAFPIDVPVTVIAPEKSGIWGKIFGFIDGKKRRKLKSLAEFIAWQSEQDAAVLGKFHQVIPIADSDATKKGDQPDKVVLPNIAETLKEIILLIANLIQSQGLMMDINMKNLNETASTKVEVAKTLLIVRDMQEYLDYDTEQKVYDVPIQVSIPKPDATEEEQADLTKYLEPSMMKIDSPEWLGRDSFQEALTDLRHAASMIRANLSNRV